MQDYSIPKVKEGSRHRENLDDGSLTLYNKQISAQPVHRDTTIYGRSLRQRR